MKLRHIYMITTLSLTLAGCGGGSTAPGQPTGKTALLLGATFSNLSGAKAIDLKVTLPVGVTPILVANSARELEIGVNGLYGIPPAAIMFGRYSATTRQVVMQAYVPQIATDFINGNFARLTYTTTGNPSFTNDSIAMEAFGAGGSDLTSQVQKSVTATTY